MVFPGLEEVRANSLRLQSIFIKLDLPTLLRPIKAYSGMEGLGQPFKSPELILKIAVFTIIMGSNNALKRYIHFG